MTVAELIERFRNHPQNAIVLAWDADSEKYEEVTGFVYDEYKLIIYTDA